jgi:hypothetical protein
MITAATASLHVRMFSRRFVLHRGDARQRALFAAEACETCGAPDGANRGTRSNSDYVLDVCDRWQTSNQRGYLYVRTLAALAQIGISAMRCGRNRALPVRG